jgi:hypothetical protein
MPSAVSPTSAKQGTHRTVRHETVWYRDPHDGHVEAEVGESFEHGRADPAYTRVLLDRHEERVRLSDLAHVSRSSGLIHRRFTTVASTPSFARRSAAASAAPTIRPAASRATSEPRRRTSARPLSKT